ncbi:MAG: hypothetical protein ACP5RH_13925 [Leptodesmis sp.]
MRWSGNDVGFAWLLGDRPQCLCHRPTLSECQANEANDNVGSR